MDLTAFNTEEADTKALLFCRWMSTCYDGEMNAQKGRWWKDQLKHFNDQVFPEYKKNGTLENMKEYLR